MINPTLELMGKFTGIETLQKINVINSRAAGRISKLQMDLAKFNLESSLAASELLSNPENYKNFITMDSEFIKLFRDQSVTMSQLTTNMFNESSDELFSMFNNITPTSQTRPDVKIKSSSVAKSAKTMVSKKSTISKTIASTSKAKRKATVKKSK